MNNMKVVKSDEATDQTEPDVKDTNYKRKDAKI